MKCRPLIWLVLLLMACTACSQAEETIQPTETPTQEPTSTSTATTPPTMTLTSTQTSTPTLVPTPVGEIIKEPLLRFSFFGPVDYEINSYIFRRSYFVATIFQKTTHWTNAIILNDMDITDQGSMSLELVLSTWLVNLDIFDATAEDTGEIYSININQYEAVAIDFSGETNSYPIKGQIIGYQPDDNHIMVGIAWIDVSDDPDIWDNQGVYLFEYVLESVKFEE